MKKVQIDPIIVLFSAFEFVQSIVETAVLIPMNVAVSLQFFFLPKTAPLLAIGCAWDCIYSNAGVVQYQTVRVLHINAAPVVLL